MILSPTMFMNVALTPFANHGTTSLRLITKHLMISEYSTHDFPKEHFLSFPLHSLVSQ